jgi:hypothetical protein
MMSSDDVRRTLEHCVRGTRLSSTFDAYAERIRIANNGNFYWRTLEIEGFEGAEIAIKLWGYDRRMSDYSSIIQPVGEGLLAIESAAPGSVKMYEVKNRDNLKIFAHPKHETGHVFVLPNELPNCGCMPKDTLLFGPDGGVGPDGVMGIIAITLGLNILNSNASLLGIVLRDKREQDLYKILTMDREGCTNVISLQPHTQGDKFLNILLGSVDGPLPSHRKRKGGGLNNALFDGATHIFANDLPYLPGYLLELTKLRSNEHSH